MFDKVSRQICNRIDELEDTMKRGGRGGGSGGSGGGGGGAGFDGRKSSVGGNDFFGGGGGGLMPLVNQQSNLLTDVRRDVDELKKLMQRLSKNAPQVSGNIVSIPVDEKKQYREQPKYSQPPAYGMESPSPYNAYPPQTAPTAPNYPPLPSVATHQPSPSSQYMAPPPMRHGYATDTEADRGRDRGARKKKNRGGRRPGSGYDSDNNSYMSEQVPMQHMPRPRSPGSVKSAPGGGNRRNRRKNKQKPLTGSWEDIRAEMNV